MEGALEEATWAAVAMGRARLAAAAAVAREPRSEAME